MPLTDLTLAELEQYVLELDAPADLADFWAGTLAEAAGYDLDVRSEPVTTGLVTVEHQDVSFTGHGGARISAWLARPAGATGDLPLVVEFQGCNGGRGLPVERLTWASAGYAHLFVDTRGQGGTWGAGGHTPDPEGSGPSAPGFLTRGVLDRETYYCRRVFTDAVRAVEALPSKQDQDPGDRRVRRSTSRTRPDRTRPG